MTKPRHSPEKRESAKLLYLRQWTVAEIEKELNVNARTIYGWRAEGQWDEFMAPASVEVLLARRIGVLSERDQKTQGERDELDKLVKAFGKLSLDLAAAKRIHAEAEVIKNKQYIPSAYPVEKSASSQEGKPGGERKKGSKAKVVKNDMSEITPEMLDKVREKMYGYQQLWYERRYDETTRRCRFILKSRQIGATYYFAFEALDNAIRTGDNQLFLSASRDQAEVFKAYIIAFAHTELGVELKGTVFIKLSNGAELRFLSTNSTTAQSYHGHLYIDEVLWIPKFNKINDIVTGCASHYKWCITYMSTVSTLTHEAWRLWTGADFTGKLVNKKKFDFDVSHAATKDGVLYGDGIWRHMVTVEDAERDGCDLFNIERLKLECRSSAIYDNKYMCIPIDDSQSVFSLELLMSCMVEGTVWDDYQPNSLRPFGNKSVSFGYDPSGTGDGAALVICDVPASIDQPFRVLAKHSFYGKAYTHQANRIEEFFNSHNVAFFGADNTGGTGITVCEKILQFYPLLTTFHYNPQVLGTLVGKMLDLMTTGRFKYLSGETDLTRAFMLIKQQGTDSGNAITYKADRITAGNGHTDHADLAWATMHAVQIEPIAQRGGTTIGFSG